jgi:hypothetical protein
MGLLARPSSAIAQDEDDPPAAEAEANDGPDAGEADEADTDEGEEAAPRRPATRQRDYLELPIEEGLKDQRFEVRRILREGQFANDQERELVKRYYWNYRFPNWTRKDNQNRLPKMRQDLRNDLRTAGSGAPHSFLNQQILDYMAKMASSERVHPAPRVNAILMIGELNQVEAARPGAIPTPLPDALPVLVRTLQNDDLPEALKAAALVGIDYQVRFGQLGDDARAALRRQMTELLTAAAPPAGRSAAGHRWMRARAAEILGHLRGPGENGTVAQALGQVVADRGASMMVRCAAAEALGGLDYADIEGLDTTPMANALASLAVDAIREEALRYQEDVQREEEEAEARLNDPRRRRTGFMEMPGERFEDEEEDESYKAFSRSRLKHRLRCVEIGLVGDSEDPNVQGIVAASSDAAAERVNGIGQLVGQAVGLFDDRRTEDGTIVEQLQGIVNQLAADENNEGEA